MGTSQGESCSLTHRLPRPQQTHLAEAQTHLGLLFPEQGCLLLAQHPGHDLKAELASKLPLREEGGNQSEQRGTALTFGGERWGWGVGVAGEGGAGYPPQMNKREPRCLEYVGFLIYLF